ncbi:MAG TPA: mechanosensitive ion channel domain-containing protein, partial [Polyangiaceae bacterium]|nr:mechanosensitive ion channel domain-containing protein [Polyangiaceae bacterium]
ESSGAPRSALGALVVLLVGWGVAQLLSLAVKKLVVRLEQLLPSRGQVEVEDAVGRHRAAKLIARAVFWIVLLVFVMAATETLGLPVVTAWLSGLTSYLPRLFLAFVVAMLGIVAGRLTRGAVSRAASSAGLGYAARLGTLAQVTVVIGALLVAVEQLGVELHFVTTALMIALGSLLGGMALAFGLGGRPVVANILAGHYVRKLYEVGQVIRIDGVEGRIVRMTPTAVILEAEEGEVAVPTGELITVRSTLVVRGGS